MAINEKNLIPNSERTPEEIKEMTRNGGIASGKARREKKLMSQIYAEFLDKDHDIIGKDGLKKKMSGSEMVSVVLSKVLSRGDSASVSACREIRETLEGKKIEIETNVDKELGEFVSSLREHASDKKTS